MDTISKATPLGKCLTEAEASRRVHISTCVGTTKSTRLHMLHFSHGFLMLSLGCYRGLSGTAFVHSRTQPIFPITIDQWHYFLISSKIGKFVICARLGFYLFNTKYTGKPVLRVSRGYSMVAI